MRSNCSHWEMYLRYKEAGGTAGKLVFHRVRTKEGVLAAKKPGADLFSCPRCLQGLGETQDALLVAQDLYARGIGSHEEVLQRQTALLELANHRAMDHHQQREFRRMCDDIQDGQLLVVMDFGQFNVMDKGEASGNRFADLVFVLYWRGVDGQLEHEYYDCVAQEGDELRNKKTTNFVQTAFLLLHAQNRFEGVRQLFVWSDCGPQHFRVSNTLYFFRLFGRVAGIQVTVFFFFPYHGHNPCDRHIGALSHHLLYALHHLDKSGETWDRATVTKHMGECSYTEVKDLPPICSFAKRVDTLTGIKSYLVFTFPKEEWAVDARKMVGGHIERLWFTPYASKSTNTKKAKLT